jgi:holo-[acyl-carrier protein] synthase
VGERVLGTGIDLVETERIAASLERFGDRFLKRVFLPGEIAYSQDHKFPALHLAARFAAKEAVSKAFGTGIGEHLGWLDIEVTRQPGEAPELRLHGKGAELALLRRVDKVMISLTHAKNYSAAVALLIGKE